MTSLREPDKTISQHESVHEDIIANSGPLFLIFGGMAMRNVQPPFEFRKITQSLSVNRIFFRDPYQCWYHRGLPGIGTSIDVVARYVRERIQELDPSRVILLGNSMGGYAAILFSKLLDLGDVIAFSPQTYLSPIKRYRMSDKRWSRAILRTYATGLFRPQSTYFDLKDVLGRPSNRRSIRIYVSRDCALDVSHARNIEHIPGVEINDAYAGGHQFIQRLRASGELRSILQAERSAA